MTGIELMGFGQGIESGNKRVDANPVKPRIINDINMLSGIEIIFCISSIIWKLSLFALIFVDYKELCSSIREVFLVIN